MITIYTNDGCSRCVIAKRHLKHELGIADFKEINIKDDFAVLREKFPDATSLPVVTNGKEYSTGLDLDRMKKVVKNDE